MCSLHAPQALETANATDAYGWLHGLAGRAISSLIIDKWKDVLSRKSGSIQSSGQFAFMNHLQTLEDSRPGFNADALLQAKTFRE